MSDHLETAERVWVTDRSWRLVSGRRCRMQGKGHATCPNAAVAELRRFRWDKGQRSELWWAYCGDHLYGRRIVGDEVQIQVSVDSPAAKRGYVA